MTGIEEILNGFASALSLTNLLVCLAGVALGTLVGVLPGLGPVGAISMLLPLTFSMEPVSALILVAGVYFGGMYGGSTTSILVNVPGEAASVVTTLDGYKMTQKGRAGAALAISAIGSFIAGTIGMVLLTFLAPPIARMAIKFGPPEYFAIVLAGLLILSRLTDKSLIRSYLLISVGVVIALVGIDPSSGMLRLTFDSPWLVDGVDFIPIIMGLYGLAEVIGSLEQVHLKPEKTDLSLKKLLPTRTEMKRSTGPIVRGGLLGFFMGLLPGPAKDRRKRWGEAPFFSFFHLEKSRDIITINEAGRKQHDQTSHLYDKLGQRLSPLPCQSGEKRANESGSR